MSAFAGAMTALLADANLGADAAYRRPPSAWTAVRVVRSVPEEQLGGLGGAGSRADSLSVVIADDALAALGLLPPLRGDEVLIIGNEDRVEDADADALGVSWRLTLATVPVPVP
jgi:hypothetical protein